MAKKSFWRKAFNAIAFAVKAILGILWKIILFLLDVLKKVFSALFSGAKSFAAKKASESRKPKNQAEFKPLVEIKKIAGDLEDFQNQLEKSKSLIGIIIGARGSGKSALGMRILENMKAEGRRVAAMGFSEEAIPPWIETVTELGQVKNGTFLLVDEGGILFSARESFSSGNKLLSELLLIARHKDLSVLFISQNSSNLEINTLRQADYLLLRRPSLLQKDFERKIIQKAYEEQGENFRKLGMHVTLVYSDAYKGFVENELPGFWSEAASKSFKNYEKKKK